MNNYKSIIKADYLQRTRSYIFIVTLVVSVFFAISFVPNANASYTTVRIGNFVGFNNAAWIGHTTAIMASVFLWLFGFFVINNGIKRDDETGVGQIIATTAISNYSYLLAKSLSNFLILLTITVVIMLVAVGLVFYRGYEYTFSATQFLLPYLLATLPSIFFVSVLAVFFEVVFRNKTNLSNITFFFLFPVIIKITQAVNNSNLIWFDVLGIKHLTTQITSFVNTKTTTTPQDISVGFNFSSNLKVNYFLFEGSVFTTEYILSRLLWIGLAFFILKLSAKLFNRFNTKPIISTKEKNNSIQEEQLITNPIKITDWPKTNIDYGIIPLIKTELKLLVSKGPKWFWLINVAGFISLFLIPLNTAYQIVLPIFWFLQINRWADLSTKEKQYGTDNFIFATYKPVQRLLSAQIIAGTILALLLAFPILLRFTLILEVSNSIEIILGALLLISFSIVSGIIFKGKRFFEIAFFFTTYAIIQKITFVDYLGATQNGITFILIQTSICCVFLVAAGTIRKYEISKL